MKCIRCGKDLGRANAKHCDYVTAQDFLIPEKREQFYAITLKDEQEVSTKIRQVVDALLLQDVKRVEAKIEDVDVQKTGLVCLDCYKASDFVIWGLHKKVE